MNAIFCTKYFCTFSVHILYWASVVVFDVAFVRFAIHFFGSHVPHLFGVTPGARNQLTVVCLLLHYTFPNFPTYHFALRCILSYSYFLSWLPVAFCT